MFVEFFAENILWFAALLFVLLMLINSYIQQNVSGVTHVSHLQLPQIQRAASVVIDVSEEQEFKSGHIAGAISMPLKTVLEKNNLLAKHGNKNIILVCQTGNRSLTAAKHLKSLGAEKLFVLKGGMLAWRKESLPTEV